MVLPPADHSDRNKWGPKLLAWIQWLFDQAPSQGEVDDLRQDVTNAEGDIDTLQNDVGQLQTDITSKADQSDLDATNLVVAGKVDQGDFDALEITVGGKADQSSLDLLDSRVDVSLHPDGTLVASEVEDAMVSGGLATPTTGEWTGVTTAVALANTREYDVRTYGAVGDGVTNDRASIQATIDAAVLAGGGVVIIPAGTWRAEITRPTVDVTPASDGEHCLVVDGDDITIRLLPGAVLDCYVYGGDPDTHWEVVSGAVWRGGGIFVTGGASYATRRRNVRVDGGGEIRGNFTYTGDHGWPANTSTGAGWDVTHKGIWYANDTYHDGHSVDNIHIHGFSGEVIYSGGGDSGATPVLGTFSVTNCYVHDTNGSAISLSARKMICHHNHVHACAGNGIENAAQDGIQSIAFNHVHDVLLDGVSAIGFGGGIGGFEIFSNDIHDCTGYGIGLMSTWNTQVHHNKIRDCVGGGIRQEIGSGYPNDDSRDVDICDNVITAHTVTMGVGISHAFGPSQAYRLRTRRNKIGRTANAVTNGYTVGEPITNDATTNMGQVDISDNEYDGQHGDTNSSRLREFLLTGTGEEYPCNIRPPYNSGFYRVSVSYRVITAATNVRVRIYYWDATDAQKYIETQASTSMAVGTYSLPDIMVPCYRRRKVEVAVQAGTANQVYVSAVIREA